jgi:serine-threonine kinase receptor-associated protein
VRTCLSLRPDLVNLLPGSFLGHKGCCWSIKLSANTQRAISGSADFSAKVWDATDGSCILTLSHAHIVRCVAINSDGTRAVTGGHEKKLRLWNLEQLLAETEGASTTAEVSQAQEFLLDDSKPAHSGVIKSIVWDEVNNQIISAGEDKAIKFWDLASMKCVHVINTEAPITSMEMGHSQRPTISLTFGNTVQFIDLRT